MYHIYRGNYIYQSFLEGDYFPLLNIAWYNGVELMRYWAPVSAYVLAFCQFLASGDPFDGYLIFVGLLFFCGAMSWLHIGKKLGRPWFGAFLGVLWFFMPNNLLALFTEGNLARSVIMIFLPLFIHACHQYLFQKDKKALPKTTLKTEKKAQVRANEILLDQGLITDEEAAKLQKLFHLYNVQYVNDIILSVLELIYNVLKIVAMFKGDSSKD